MKVTIAKSSGFCFGVRRAIDLSKYLASSKDNVYVLGDVVHNTFVVKDLEDMGLKKIKQIRKQKKNPILIIRAHGATKNTFEKAIASGYKVVDATCPMVQDIYKIGRKLEKNNKIIIIGDKNHDEVKGIAGQLKKRSIVIESPKDVTAKKLSSIKKAAVITQSTQSIENIEAIMGKLAAVIPDVTLHNTTCRTTIIKQQEIKSLPKKNDVIIIVGSRTSANTKRLYEISRTLNKKTHWVGSAKDLKKAWFKGAEKVGIMSGASTPDKITQEIAKKLKTL